MVALLTLKSSGRSGVTSIPAFLLADKMAPIGWRFPFLEDLQYSVIILYFRLSWGLLYIVSAIIIATLMALVATTYVFVQSSFGVIFLLFSLYGIATVSLDDVFA